MSRLHHAGTVTQPPWRVQGRCTSGDTTGAAAASIRRKRNQRHPVRPVGLTSRIRRRRLGAGLSQTDVAEALGVGQAAVSHWGMDYDEPRLQRLVRPSELLECSFDDLLVLWHDQDPHLADRREVCAEVSG